MPDAPLTNAAVDRLRDGFAALNSLDDPSADLSSGVTNDFQYEDHRSGGVNFGRIDTSGWAEFLRSFWGLTPGRTRRSISEVIAIQGQRSAAVVVLIDFGNETFSEFIMCLRLDPGLQQMQRIAHYDIEDIVGATAGLDRLSREFGTE